MNTNKHEQATGGPVDVLNAALGAWSAVEGAVRFQMARGLLRYYELVWKGESIQSPEAEEARARLNRFLTPSQN